jgi:two-component system sensor histidine kinase BaeS
MGPPLRRPWRRPPWWPAGEAWPPGPPSGRPGPPRFIWRLGCLLAFLLAFTTGAGLLAGWLAASALGVALPGRAWPILLTVLLVMGIAATAGGGRLRRLARPLGALSRAAERIEAGDYSARVDGQGPPELRSLARAFNAMSERLQITDQQRRSFLADVTHELRTPLSVIRGQAEAIADGVYPGDHEHLTPILEATRSLERLTEDLRTLALAESGNLALKREEVEVAPLVNDVVAAWQPQAEAAGVALEADPAGNLPSASLDPARIWGVLGNLIANALRHTPRGGSIRVGARAPNGPVEITVTDTGEGIPPDLLPHVFERFARAPGSPGSGLGLAIAHDVVVAHGGTIDIQSRPGQGTSVRLTLAGSS